MLVAAFRSAFRSFSRVISAVALAAAALALAIWLPNLSLLRIVATDDATGIGQKLQVAFSLLGSLTTNFTPLAAASVVIAAALLGINAVLAYHLVRRSRGQGVGRAAAASGIGGAVSGVLGVGCAACGSVIASAALGTAAGAGLLALLPLGGQEFGMIGVLLLAASTYALLKRIGQPLACPVGVAHQ